jgi:hypothetical protein
MQPKIPPPAQQNVITFYDLPKYDITSTKLAILIKEKSGVDILRPQFHESINMPFCEAVLKIDNSD